MQAWLKYLRNQYPTVAFKASTQNQNEKLSQSSVPVELAKDNLLQSANCLGADILLKLLKKFTNINDVRQSISVGIIGKPLFYILIWSYKGLTKVNLNKRSSERWKK